MRGFDEGRVLAPVLAALLAVVVGGAVDLYLDAPSGWTAHVAFEMALVAYSLGLAGYLARRWWRTSRSLVRTEEALESREVERDRWRRRARSLLEDLGVQLDRQFDEWGLTPSEKEVALLLVKGHSHKRIADMTDRSDRTVRQHASAVYEKAGVGGRAELAAFFLAELSLPASGGSASGERSGRDRG